MTAKAKIQEQRATIKCLELIQQGLENGQAVGEIKDGLEANGFNMSEREIRQAIKDLKTDYPGSAAQHIRECLDAGILKPLDIEVALAKKGIRVSQGNVNAVKAEWKHKKEWIAETSNGAPEPSNSKPAMSDAQIQFDFVAALFPAVERFGWEAVKDCVADLERKQQINAEFYGQRNGK